MASTASTAINTSNYQYDVFLNHRGCDTKNNFACHLYSRLRLHGFRVFLDKEEMEEGYDLTYQIKAAIKNASVHVAIFSEKYAESMWCLDELVLMVESGAIIIPVFFKNVKPSHIRWLGSQTRVTQQSGSQTRETEQNRNQADNNPQKPQFAKGFWKLQNKTHNGQQWRHDDNTIGKWTDALSKVSNMIGFELAACNGYEAELVEKIVRRLSEIVKKSPFSVPKYEVGLDEKVEDFREKVWSNQRENEKAQVVGIVGLGGVGKTTLAKEIGRIEGPAYRNYCFFPVSRNECRNRPDSLFGELFKGLSDLNLLPTSVDAVNLLDVTNDSVDMIKNYPSLVILDGVDNVKCREELLRIQEVLHSKSLILITSRDLNVLMCSKVEAIYDLHGLDTYCSQKLFCFHAFHEPAPLQGYEYLVDCFLKVCDGSPLLLKLLGALLCGNNDRFYWEDLLDSFQPIKKQEEKLKVIYHKLGTEEQQTFLDIAGKFVGESTDNALKYWKASGRRGIWFQFLLEKRLVEVVEVDSAKVKVDSAKVEVDSATCIQMHDLLKCLGEEIEATE